MKQDTIDKLVILKRKRDFRMIAGMLSEIFTELERLDSEKASKAGRKKKVSKG